MTNGIAELKKKIIKQNREIQHLKSLVTKDALTGLYNRHGFEEMAEFLFTEVRHAIRAQEQREHFWIDALGLAIFDIDNFKKVNDTLGHRMGDQVLQYVAAEISKRVRTSDIVARVGGEEIALLLVGAEDGAALRVVDDIRRGIRSHLKLKKLPTFKVTVSAGLSFVTATTKSLDELYRQADEALYKAKTTGKDRVVIGGSAGSKERRSR